MCWSILAENKLKKKILNKDQSCTHTTASWYWILAFLPYRMEDACLPFELANSVYQHRFVRLPFYYYWFRKIELRWDWLRRLMFILSLAKICRVIQKLTLALARISVMTQVFNRLRREIGPINVKQFPLRTGGGNLNCWNARSRGF